MVSYKVLKNIFTIKTRLFKKEPALKIIDLDDDTEVLKIDKIGITNLGTGIVIFKTEEGNEFPITAFSAETATLISEFYEGKIDEIPSMYNTIEHICEELEIHLVKVKIYDSGNALRANLYFTGKKVLILRNYRSSDAIALAVLYKIPILIKKHLLEQSPQIKIK